MSLDRATTVGDPHRVPSGPVFTPERANRALVLVRQIVADIVVVGPRAGSFRRTRYVIDTTGTTPVVIERRDLTPLGWPLGADLYQQLTTQPWEES